MKKLYGVLPCIALFIVLSGCGRATEAEERHEAKQRNRRHVGGDAFYYYTWEEKE